MFISKQHYSIVLTIILFIEFSFQTFSQRLEFKNYTTKDGLLTDEVYNLHQDKQGYIWIFSTRGTLKFNGREFKPVLLNLPINEAFIYTVYENKAGKKWVANSNANIYEIRNDSAILIQGIEEVSLRLKNSISEISQLCIDKGESIFAITKGRSYKFKKEKGKYILSKEDNFVFNDSIIIGLVQKGDVIIPFRNRFKNDEFILIQKKENQYLKSTNGNLFKLADFVQIFNFRNFKKIDDCIYYTYSSFLAKISNENKISTINVGAIIVSYNIAENKHKWIGTLNGGLYELNERDSIVNHYFEDLTINSILIDSQNGVWVSSDGAGLFYCNNINVRALSNAFGVLKKIYFLRKINDVLLFGDSKGKVIQIKSDSKTTIRKADGNPAINAYKYKNKVILLLLFGVESYDILKNKKEVVKEKGEKLYDVKIINDTIIFQWRRGFIYMVNHKVFKKVDFSTKLNSFLFYKNKLLFATEDGAYEYNPANFIQGRRIGNVTIPDIIVPSQPKYLNQTSNFPIKSITENLSNNSIWFCTQGFGLFCLIDDSLTGYNTQNGLPSDVIDNIGFANDGSALLSTNKGLYKSKLINPVSSGYNKWQKLYSGEIENALWFENKIYGLTGSRLFYINDNELKELNQLISFNLQSITEGNSLLQLNKNNYYTINNKPIEFIFDIVCFESERPGLHYQLFGAQIDSGVVATDKIKFNQLEPGQYTLTAYPKINDYKANEIKLIFTVVPGFQQTWKFKMMIGTIILGCLTTITQFLLKRQKRKQTEKAKNDQLIEEYKLIALKAQINPHFMSNCLSAIQNLVRRNQTDKATVYIAKFGYLVRRILDFSTKPLITLDEELNLTETYLELESLRFENKFKFQIRLTDNVDAKNCLIPPLLLNPIVENALWHGLLPIQNIREPLLLIEVKIIENQLRIIVKDNGDGFKSNININENRVSRGLSLTEQRLRNLNFLSKTSISKLQVTSNNNVKGTEIEVCLPLDL